MKNGGFLNDVHYLFLVWITMSPGTMVMLGLDLFKSLPVAMACSVERMRSPALMSFCQPRCLPVAGWVISPPMPKIIKASSLATPRSSPISMVTAMPVFLIFAAALLCASRILAQPSPPSGSLSFGKGGCRPCLM